MQKVIRQEIVKYSESQESFEIETFGDLQYMPSKTEMVMAIFGAFHKTGNGTLLYSASVEREKGGQLGHDPHSEYLDDYRALKAGNVEKIY